MTCLAFGGAKLSITVIVFCKKFGPISYHWAFFYTLWCFQRVKMETSHKNWFNKPYPAGNYMFKVKNRNSRTMSEICSELTMMAPGAILVSLLLILNIFYTLFWCFYCEHWAGKCRPGIDVFEKFIAGKLHDRLILKRKENVFAHISSFKYFHIQVQKTRWEYDERRLINNTSLDNSWADTRSLCGQ